MSRSKKGTNEQLMAQYLKGRSDAEKAAVLKQVTDLGIAPDDPLWAVLISVNAAVVLLQDAPAQLERSRVALQQDLNSSAISFRQLIAAMHSNVEVLTPLSNAAPALQVELQVLQDKTIALITQVDEAVLLLNNTMTTWQGMISTYQQQVTTQSQVVNSLAKVLRVLERRPSFLWSSGPVITWAAVYSIVFSLVGTVTAGIILVRML
ncbi:hypothetical protein Lepto7375DRAFT_0076 [Leptolyngbya sp. PCC 7375]|nr:hypothetical protein Lepto7375DRAFT_0076 [Leptolyngbya sp. PCC 7375]